MAKVVEDSGSKLVSCLKKERVTVRFVPNQNGKITDPKHALYGGMAETATRTFYVPKLTSGKYVNVLTDDEKEFLEEYMGMDKGALSIYRNTNNFWNINNPNGVAFVRLTKDDNYLDLSDPQDYIRYKILLANKDYICPSLDDLQNRRKATYQFVLIREGDEYKDRQGKMNTMMQCYKEFGKIEDNWDILKLVVDTFYSKNFADSNKLEFLQAKANEAIQADSKKFYSVITDPYLTTKVLLRKCVANGSVTLRGNYYYITESNTPLCESGENPTFDVAAKFLNSPKNQDMLFMLQAKINA